MKYYKRKGYPDIIYRLNDKEINEDSRLVLQYQNSTKEYGNNWYYTEYRPEDVDREEFMFTRLSEEEEFLLNL